MNLTVIDKIEKYGTYIKVRSQKLEKKGFQSKKYSHLTYLDQMTRFPSTPKNFIFDSTFI